MKGKDLLDKMELIDPAYIEAAEAVPVKKKTWVKWAVPAACLCVVLLITGIVLARKGFLPGIIQAQAADLMEGISAQTVDMDTKIDAYSREITDFAVRLFNETDKETSDNANTLVSPLSVLLALSMTANGATEETLIQMQDVLGLSTDKLNEFAYTYLQSLSERSDNWGTLKIANSIWFKTDPLFNVNRDFLQLNADYYNAELYAAPFDDSTVKNINNWVKDKTEGMIPKVLDKIEDDTIMYLINALAFDAEWQVRYNENQVSNDIFTTETGENRTVSFLSNKENTYIADENAVGFIKYYKGKKYAFAAILPNDGISPAEYLNTLTGEHLSEMIETAERCDVLTKIPKFKTEYTTEMKEVLKSMGMTLAFDKEEAEFGGVGTYGINRNIYISRVLHKTFIQVDEKGTKAGAATVVATTVQGAKIGSAEPKEVYLTRPFIYMLIDTEANIPFFIGVMRNPEKTSEESNSVSGKQLSDNERLALLESKKDEFLSLLNERINGTKTAYCYGNMSFDQFVTFEKQTKWSRGKYVMTVTPAMLLPDGQYSTELSPTIRMFFDFPENEEYRILGYMIDPGENVVERALYGVDIISGDPVNDITVETDNGTLHAYVKAQYEAVTDRYNNIHIDLINNGEIVDLLEFPGDLGRLYTAKYDGKDCIYFISSSVYTGAYSVNACGWVTADGGKLKYTANGDGLETYMVMTDSDANVYPYYEIWNPRE
jgi:serpin B